jgi:SAUR family protein
MEADAKGLKVRRKFIKLWREFVLCKGSRSHYTPNNQIHGSDTSQSHSLSQETLLRANTPTAHPDLSGQDEDQCLRTGHIKPYGSCSNLLARTKRHICRHLSCRYGSFVEKNDKKNGYPPKDVPKGFLAVYVGDAQEEQTRFVIPVCYFNHPLFLHLLQEAEHVYGFHQKGVFTIPCQVSDFEYLQWLIERESAQDSSGNRF